MRFFVSLLVLVPLQAANNYLLVGTGQSLCYGANSSPISTTQPFSNLMLNAVLGTTLIPLIEPATGDTGSTESPSSGTANQLAAWNSTAQVMTKSCIGGTAYTGLKKGTTSYSNSLTEAGNVKSAVIANGNTFVLLGIVNEHGEQDQSIGTTTAQYKADVLQWQSDYETDLNTTTGHSGTVPFFLSQMSSWTGFGFATPTTAISQWQAFEAAPTKIVITGPKYQFLYSNFAHLTSAGYLWLGEMRAKSINRYIQNGNAYPLSPRSITVSGSTVTARFWVPVGNLVLDTTTVTQQTNYGFEWSDGSSRTITGVSVSGDTATITLSGTPSGTETLAYALTGTINATPGFSNAASGAPYGNLRDSDTLTSRNGNALWDWAVTFTTTLPFTSNAPNITSGSAMAGTYSLAGPTVVK